MTGYGGRNGRVTLAVAAAISALTLGGCGLTADPAPSSIVIPPPNALSTERAPASTTPSTARESITPSRPPTSEEPTSEDPDDQDGSTVSGMVSRGDPVDPERFHIMSTSQTGPRREAGGYHFTTPRRDLRCSVGNNPTGELACVTERPVGPADPPAAAGSCDWSRELFTLSAEALQAGGCANRYPVGHRAAVVGFGKTLTVEGYSCLVEPEGTICLTTDSGRGFSISEHGLRELTADEAADLAF